MPQIGLDYKKNGQTHKIHWTNPLLGKQTYRAESEKTETRDIMGSSPSLLACVSQPPQARESVAKARRRIGEVGIITFDVIKMSSKSIFELKETFVLKYNNLLLLFQNSSFPQNETAFV